MNKASRPHDDEVVVELLREDPSFVREYLDAAMLKEMARTNRALINYLNRYASAFNPSLVKWIGLKEYSYTALTWT